jgi:hypothetical protein
VFKNNVPSTTIQDYCILGTSIVLFMVLEFWEGGFVNMGLELPMDVEHIMRLGGWESLDMVLRYTRSVRFEESLRVFMGLMK